jgi:hypothetical protein
MPRVVPRRRLPLLVAALIAVPLLLSGCRGGSGDRAPDTARPRPAIRPTVNPADYEGVCATPPKPVPEAAVYLGGFGPHPVVFVGRDVSYEGVLPATWQPADPYKVELVACVERASAGTPISCPYTDDAGHLYTRYVFHTKFRIRLFGATNAKLVTDAEVVASGVPGGRLEEECPASVKAVNGLGPGSVVTTLTARDIMEALDKYVR